MGSVTLQALRVREKYSVGREVLSFKVFLIFFICETFGHFPCVLRISLIKMKIVMIRTFWLFKEHFVRYVTGIQFDLF